MSTEEITIEIDQHDVIHDENEPMETNTECEKTKSDTNNTNEKTNTESKKTKSETSKYTTNEKPDQTRSNNTSNKRSKYDIDPNRSHIFYSDIEMPEEFLKDLPKQVTYKFMKGSLEDIARDIKIDINDLKPKNMLLACFGKQVLQRSNQSVIEVVNELVDMVDSEGIHQIAPSTNHFIPNKPQSWDAVASFNCQMRIINIDRGLPPLTLHKCLMDREFVDHGPLIINGRMWLEYLYGEGLGENLSRAGLGKYKHFFMMAFAYQFKKQDRNPSVRDMGTPKPPPLAATKGYEDYPFMRNILEERGLLNLRGVYNRAVDPPKPRKQQDQNEQKATPVKQRSKSDTNINIRDQKIEKEERPKTWYAENVQVTETQGARRKVSLPSTSSDSGFINSEDRNYNEDEDQIEKIYKGIRRKYISYESLESAYDKLKNEKHEETTYYKKKIDKLYIENEELREYQTKTQKAYDDFKIETDIFVQSVEKLQQENKDLKASAQEDKDQLKSALRKLDVREEEIRMKDERLKMLQGQYDFFKSLQNDVSDYFQDKTDKKKKRK